MKLFIDASAMIAILDQEPGHVELAARLDQAATRYWSAMSCWESINALRRLRKDCDLSAARQEIEAYAAAKQMTLVAVAETERQFALEAYRIYGKGRHPARLNMGDCFAYACAKANDAALLYKGGDFALTDLA